MALLVLAGCAMNQEGAGLTLEQGVARARTYVEDTLSAVANDLDVEPDEGSGPTECGGSLGAGTDTFSDDYGVKIVLANQDMAQRLFEETASYWQSKGYEVSFENAQPGEPIGDDSVVAVGIEEGFFGALELFPSRNRAYLGISTPCLPH